jgi:hypothetical protein
MVSTASQIVRHTHRDASHFSYSRLEVLWAVASFLVLILCWDATFRLDQKVSVPRVRIAHALEEERAARQSSSHPLTEFE